MCAKVEQPGSSLLVYIPYIQHLIDAMGRNGAHFKRLKLGGNGACIIYSIYIFINMNRIRIYIIYIYINISK